MTLGELISRICDVLSIETTNYRTYSRQAIVDHVNRGIMIFRQEVEDVWYRTNVPLVANQSIYNFPTQNVRAQRIAYNDSTMEPDTILGLQAIDAKWETTPGSEPFIWSSDGLPHTQFRVYPKPTVSSGDTFGFSAELGVVVRWQTGGADATFSQETGIVVDVTDSTFDSELGEVQFVSSPGLAQLEVWGTAKPGTLSGDGDLVPVKCGYELAPAWYALWQTYLEEAEHHDSQLAAFYQGMWNDLLARAKERQAAPLPNQVHVLGSGGIRQKEFPDFHPQMTVNGVPIVVSWGRSGLGPMLGD